MTSKRKLEEARFFIELLETLEERGESLSHGEYHASEASFLLSAILNAFYGSLAMLYETEGIARELVDQFKRQYPDVYAHGSGTRAITVHKAHIETSNPGDGYIRPRGDQVNFHFTKRPKLAPPVEPGVFRFGQKYFYVKLEPSGHEVRIKDFCLAHLGNLKAFRKSLGLDLQQPPPSPSEQ